MYTLEEIEEEARAKGWRMFWIWLLAFGIPMGILTYMVAGDKLMPPNLMTILSLTDCGVLLGAMAMAAVAYHNAKKKLEAENEQERQYKRDRQYKRMEELLEKMSNENS